MTRRLVATYLILATVVLVALVVPLGIVNQRSQRDDLERRVERDAVALAAFSEDLLQEGALPGDATLEAIARDYAAATDARVVIVDAQGRLVADSSSDRPLGRDFGNRPEIAAALQGNVAVGTRRSQTLGRGILYVAVPVASGGEVHGAVRVTVPTSRVDRSIVRYWLVLALTALIVLAAVAIAGRVLARWVTRPLDRLGAAARAAGEGDLTARADVHEGPPEVQRLAQDFDHMVERLEHLVSTQQEFVADASHQLRSPLTGLRLRLENMAGTEVSPEEAETAIGEVDRLSRLIDGLLALARADAPDAEPPAPVDLAAALAERAQAWEPVAADRGVAIAVDAGGAPWARAVPGALEQVLDNLLANAVEASPSGGRITLSARTEGSEAVVEVADQGPGMSEERRRRAFDRFATWSGDGGTGLGLAIVKRLVEEDGGSVALAPVEPSGLRAIVRLPASPPARIGDPNPT